MGNNRCRNCVHYMQMSKYKREVCTRDGIIDGNDDEGWRLKISPLLHYSKICDHFAGIPEKEPLLVFDGYRK